MSAPLDPQALGFLHARARTAAPLDLAVEVQRWPGQRHGLLRLQDAADRARAAAGDALRRAFEGAP